MSMLNEKKVKRVACLYRVSTKGQVDKNDIPLQRMACREFIANQPNWVLVREYYERGVSGYKLSADERDVLQQIKEDALKKEFDVLLVFMFDRLGRRDDETPFIVEWFVKQGIEVWSTQEGQQRFNDHIDKLLNYLRFWQSAGESYKTSIRVDNRHKQMVKEGLYRGGGCPYGYKLVPSGVFNKKGKELKKLAINEEEAKIVRLIFDLVLTKGYGAHRIAQYLNEKGIPTRTGTLWRATVIDFMLRNPIYMGYMVYGKHKSTETSKKARQPFDNWILSETPIDELVIISEEEWYRVKQIRESRDTDKDIKFPVSTKSPLLLVGFIYCKHCGSPLFTSYVHKKYVRKDGTIHERFEGKYRCDGKFNSKKHCDGQHTYGQKKIEESFNKALKMFIDGLQKADFETEIQKRIQELENASLKELKQLQKRNEKNYIELDTLNKEISKSILGESPFKPETLAQAIQNKEKEIQEINEKIEQLTKIVNEDKEKINNLKMLKQTIPLWWEMYEKAEIEEKKMMLSQILDRVEVGKDGIEIKFKLHIAQLLKGIGMQNYLNWESATLTLWRPLVRVQ